MYIDTHCHLNFVVFAEDWRKVVQEAIKQGVEKMMVVGADLESSEKAVELATRHQNLYATVGIHPHHCQSKIDINKLEGLAKNKKVVAIGECGLDYHVYKKSKYKNREITTEIKTLQKRLFGQQIQLAKKLHLPLVIHSREAGEETLDALNHFCKDDGTLPKGVFHCISGSKKLLKKILTLGFYVGIDGNIVYSQEVQNLAKLIPRERLLLESDSPYLAPQHDGSRNTPASVKIVAQSLSQLTQTTINQIATETTTNSQKLFTI